MKSKSYTYELHRKHGTEGIRAEADGRVYGDECEPLWLTFVLWVMYQLRR